MDPNKIYYHPHGHPIPQIVNPPQGINYGYPQPHLDNKPYLYNNIQQGQPIYYEQRPPSLHGQKVVIDQGGVQNIPNQKLYAENNQRQFVQKGQNLQNFHPAQNMQTTQHFVVQGVRTFKISKQFKTYKQPNQLLWKKCRNNSL